jgi:hypothetical protein
LVCPQCGERKARRACPALGVQICTVCCGTKRQTLITCPSDCVYLAVAREHPPAVALRRQQHDVGAVVRCLRDLSERQSELFFLIVSFLLGYEPPELHPLIDEDVAEAMDALAATFETAGRGVIYEHRPASLAGERLASGLKPLLTEAGRTGGSAFQRDASVVMRRVAAAARERTPEHAGNRRAFLDLMGRVIQTHAKGAADPESAAAKADDGPRVIIP